MLRMQEPIYTILYTYINITYFYEEDELIEVAISLI